MSKVAVIGLGYVGLPLAALCATKGRQVAGLNTNQSKVQGWRVRFGRQRSLLLTSPWGV